MTDTNIKELNAKPLVVGVSSRALFDLTESHRVFEEQGMAEFARYQRRLENVVLEPGHAFSMVRKLLALNAHRDLHPGVEVILLSRNSADTGLRVFNSIEHYDLDIERAVFTSGERPFRYLASFNADLYLSTNAKDVRKALEAGLAAATILPHPPKEKDSDQLRIAFDGDAVLFSDEAERIFQEQGLAAFSAAEKREATSPLQHGPFKPVLEALHKIQAAYPAENNPIRTALVTARSAPAHKRVILTLREWGIRIDEAMFLGGKPKGPFLAAFGADIFFDDQQVHCQSAVAHVSTGHVPSGVVNEENAGE